MPFAPSSKDRLTRHDLGRFAGDTLFDRLGRGVCAAGVTAAQGALRGLGGRPATRRQCRGGRVVDAAGGHGLLAHVMLLLDDTSTEAIVVDPSTPDSAAVLHASLVAAWPRLAGRIRRHAVLDRRLAARAR